MSFVHVICGQTARWKLYVAYEICFERMFNFIERTWSHLLCYCMLQVFSYSYF